MTRVVSLVAAFLAVLTVSAGERPLGDAVGLGRTEVVVVLDSPPLGEAPGTGATIDAEQRTFRRALAARIPGSSIGWRYRLVVNGFSVSVPSAEVPQLRALPAVRDVLPSATYQPQGDSTSGQIGAPALWGPTLDTAGQGVKIGIIDSGVDPSHPYFDPTGYTMPPGFPKGQRQFTTAKVIVARVFAPKGAPAPSARLAFDPEDISHGTHVAGIAAGDPDTPAPGGHISGVAPRAYIGNYKVFVDTDSGLSPNANSPAIVAAIEAAVADGMDVINFSGGEPEIDPSRDIVARALDAAAAAGVVPVVAAGNDFYDVGAGSVSSPASSNAAIAVGAVEIGGNPVTRVHADFSSVGPTTISLRLKPDVAAPGVGVLSSVPGGWGILSGTSMAAPHAAGAAALLRQRHPAWSVAEIKSALVQSGTDATDEQGKPLQPQFQGGGVIALQRADDPLLFAQPSALSLGLLSRGSTLTRSITLEAADGGAGSWDVVKVTRTAPGGTHLALPSTIDVPGTLDVGLTVASSAKGGDVDGYIVLRHGTDVRRIPFWGHVSTNALARHETLALERPGAYRGTTARQPALVSRYRYPDNPRGLDLTTVLRGPERVYRIDLRKRVANFGVVVTRLGPRVRVEPRVVAAIDESRLTGYAGLPVTYNPYLDEFRVPELAAGALSPAPGVYAVVFDSATRAEAGSFAFRYWVNDVTPPTLRLRSRTVSRGQPLEVVATDRGSGVYARSIVASIDGSRAARTFRRGIISIRLAGLAPGRHRLRLRASDYQETKNTENVGPILPNTRTITVTFSVR